MDHQEFLAKLGVELAPGDFHGPSTRIAEQSYDVMTKFHQSQKVSFRAGGLRIGIFKYSEVCGGWGGGTSELCLKRTILLLRGEGLVNLISATIFPRLIN